MAENYPGENPQHQGGQPGSPAWQGQPGRQPPPPPPPPTPPPTALQVEAIKGKVAAGLKEAEARIGDANRALKGSDDTLGKSIGSIVIDYGNKVDAFGQELDKQIEEQDCKAKAIKPKVSDPGAVDRKIAKYDNATWELYHAIEKWLAALGTATATLATDLDAALTVEATLKATQDRAKQLQDRIGRLRDLVKQIQGYDTEQKYAKAWFLVREHHRTLEEVRALSGGDRMASPDQFEDELKTVAKACADAAEKLRKAKYECEQAVAKLAGGVNALVKRVDERQQTLLALVQ
jgi:hypothetical protein